MYAELSNELNDEGSVSPIPMIRKDPRRWFILIMFCFVATLQVISWLLLSPIQREVGVAYGDTYDADFVAWSLNLGNITYMVFTLPSSWLTSRYGPRFSTLSIAMLIFHTCT